MDFYYLNSTQTIRSIRRSARFLSMEIAPYKKPRTQNIPGNLYVDESCIDCDVCRWMCPSVYGRKGIKAAVIAQPQSQPEKLQAYAAMVSCPVGSIRTRFSDPIVKSVIDNVFPAEIDPLRIPGVMHLGYHSPLSFGATPYFIRRPGGNIMIDSPRFNAKLADSLDAEGGLAMIILTHKDDIADHDKWKVRFPAAQRVIHRTDVTRLSEGCEVKLEGGGPWNPFPDVEVLHTPGHTAGSISILFTPKASPDTETDPYESVLFTGDHLAYSAEKGRLDGFKSYNQGNVLVQMDSIAMLAQDDYDFRWILPGHGRMVRFQSLQEKNDSVREALEWFRREDQTKGMLGIGYR